VRTAEFPDTTFVFIFLKRFIEEVILLPAQIGTEAAVVAALQVRGKGTIAAIRGEGDESAVVGLEDAETLVAELGIVEVGTIDAVFAALEELSVVTILAVFR